MKDLAKLDKKMIKCFWKSPFSPKQVVTGLISSKFIKNSMRRALNINRPKKGKMHGEV